MPGPATSLVWIGVILFCNLKDRENILLGVIYRSMSQTLFRVGTKLVFLKTQPTGGLGRNLTAFYGKIITTINRQSNFNLGD